MKHFVVVFFALYFLNACSPVHVVKPLKKGEQQAGVSLGGPLIKFSGAVIPVPFTSVHYARGLSEKFTIYGTVYTTAALFGVGQTDLGLSYRLLERDSISGLSLNAGFNAGTFFQPGTSRIWPELNLNYYRHYGNRRNFFYGGAGSWIELERRGTHDRPIQSRIRPWLHLGHTWNRTRFSYQLEYRLLSPFQSNQDVVIDYLRLTGNRGVSGLYFSFTRRIGK